MDDNKRRINVAKIILERIQELTGSFHAMTLKLHLEAED
jgi:hypothetical protein